MKNDFTKSAVLKVDDGLGLIFGWTIVCKQDGADYFDKQGDHIPEDAMLEAAADFMLNSRAGGEMHARTADGEVVKAGTVVFAWPMTQEVAKALNITTPTTGLLVAIRPDDNSALVKARNGEYRGFSIGGSRIEDEEVDD